MQKLNFPQYEFKIKNIDESRDLIFDDVRKKYLQLTPEEWVRQHVVKLLIELGYPKSHIRLEQEIKLYAKKKRFDALVCNAQNEAIILVECKAPHVKINQDTLDQICRYNVVSRAPILFISNGIQHYCLAYENDKYQFIQSIPSYHQLNQVV